MDVNEITLGDWLRSKVNSKFESKKYTTIDTEKNTLQIILSDLHIGEQTDTFSYKIACQRLANAAEELRKRHRTGVDEVIVCLGGDLVDGSEVFDKQNALLEFEPLNQVALCAELIWHFLKDLRLRFNCPIRVQSWWGNHGVIDKTSSDLNNYDNFVVKMLSLLADKSQHENIIINAGYDEICLYDVKGWTFFGKHKGPKHTGTPAMTTKLGAWSVLFEPDVFIFAHWHTVGFNAWTDKLIIYNGGLPGRNSFSDGIAVGGPPRQVYFTTSTKCAANNFGYLEWKQYD